MIDHGLPWPLLRTMAALTFFTGSDANMLPQSFILLQSVRETAPDANLVFCDFGLTPAQRGFVERRCKLATNSYLPEHRLHPWLRKGSLVDFMSGEFEVAVWIDADMLLLDDPRDELGAIIDDMAAKNQSIAACPDAPSLTLDRYMIWCTTAGAHIDQFRRDLHQRRISGAHNYLNSGFFVVRSRRWLKDWKQATLAAVPDEYLFEQNAFNVMAWREPIKVRSLDTARWNAHGPILARIGVDHQGKVTCYDRRVVGLHATSGDRALVRNERLEWAADGRPLVSNGFKFFTHPALRELQRGLFERFVAENSAGLAEIF
jgi:hypothetical protein